MGGLGVGHPALQQRRHRQVPADQEAQQPVVLVDVRLGPSGEQDRAAGVAAGPGELGPEDGQHRRDVGVPADRPGPGRLGAAGGMGALGVGE
jgi:hypothetical protein